MLGFYREGSDLLFCSPSNAAVALPSQSAENRVLEQAMCTQLHSEMSAHRTPNDWYRSIGGEGCIKKVQKYLPKG